MCNRVILQEKVVVKKVVEADAFKQWEEHKIDRLEEREMMARVDRFVLSKQKDQDDSEGELARLIADLRQLSSQKEVSLRCVRPCCNAVE
jgi:hypothetical protein